MSKYKVTWPITLYHQKQQTTPGWGKSRGQRGGKAELLWGPKGDGSKIAKEVQETRTQPQAPADTYVTDEVVLSRNVFGGNCYNLTSLALGFLPPSKEEINALRPANAHKQPVDCEDLRDALNAGHYPVTLQKCSSFQFFSDLTDRTTGMFVIMGDAHTGKGDSSAPHFASFDAGRGLLYDRRDHLWLLEPKDRTMEGAKAFFYRRYERPGEPNAGWKVLRQVWQVVPKPDSAIQQIIGRRVMKRFDHHGWHHGTVTSVCDFYQVQYGDGDVEDLSFNELSKILIQEDVHTASAAMELISHQTPVSRDVTDA